MVLVRQIVTTSPFGQGERVSKCIAARSLCMPATTACVAARHQPLDGDLGDGLPRGALTHRTGISMILAAHC
jgi:hypothetical protein